MIMGVSDRGAECTQEIVQASTKKPWTIFTLGEAVYICVFSLAMSLKQDKNIVLAYLRGRAP
jgi:hypothetical protein